MSRKSFIIFSNLTFFFVFCLNLYSKSWLQQEPEYYLKKGKLQYQSEMYNYAIENFKKAFNGNKNFYEAANYLAKIYILKNKRYYAIEWLSKSLVINKNQPDTENKIGELLDFFGKQKQAFLHFKNAVKLNPNHILANLNLVRYYIEEKKIDIANKHFLKSYNAGLQKEKQTFFKAKTFFNNQKYKKAINLLRKVIKKNPANIKAYFMITDAYRRTKQFLYATKYLEQIKFYKPNLEKAYVYLANIYFNQKLPGKRRYYINLAIENIKQAIKLNSSNAENYFTLSYFYEQIGQEIKAKKYLNLANHYAKITVQEPH